MSDDKQFVKVGSVGPGDILVHDKYGEVEVKEDTDTELLYIETDEGDMDLDGFIEEDAGDESRGEVYVGFTK